MTTRTFRVNKWFRRQHLATIGFILAMLAIGMIQYQTVQTAARIKSEARARAVALENEATARAVALANEQKARTAYLCNVQKELRQDIEDRDAQQVDNLIKAFPESFPTAEAALFRAAILEDLPDLGGGIKCPPPPR